MIQSFEFSYELSVRMLRRVLMERSTSPPSVAELSFADLMRAAADAGWLADPQAWRAWRELRNATSHAYSEAKAQAVAEQAMGFAADASTLLSAMEASLAS